MRIPIIIIYLVNFSVLLGKRVCKYLSLDFYLNCIEVDKKISILTEMTTLAPLQENLNEANFVYGLSHSSSQIISGSPLLDALGDKSSWSSSSWKNKSTDEAGVVRAKKTSWYNALYPSYKSRSEDFKKIFTTLPSNERLIVGKFFVLLMSLEKINHVCKYYHRIKIAFVRRNLIADKSLLLFKHKLTYILRVQCTLF